MGIQPSEKQDFYNIIERGGNAKEDFEIVEEDDSYPTHGVGPITRVAKIRNTNTGVERTYRTGHLTAWVVEFERDLKAGVFLG